MNMTIETLFDDYLNTARTGALWEELHTVSAAIDAAIQVGDTDRAMELTGEYELAAARCGFYAGFVAALGLRQPMQGAA